MTALDLENICSQVRDLIIQTGLFLKEEQSRLCRADISLKGLGNYVTRIDKQAEQQLVSALSKLLPEASFLTEEKTVEQSVTNNSGLMWIIDPLDGTGNYVHGDLPYSISIALGYGTNILMGVVHDPVRNETFWATAHHQAMLNDSPLSVSNHSTIDNAYIGTGFPYNMNPEDMKLMHRLFSHFNRCSIRMKASSALEICYVACGRYDAYFHIGLSPWDMAAATFMAEQAGATCSDFGLSSDYLFAKQLLVANPSLHHQLYNTLFLNTTHHYG